MASKEMSCARLGGHRIWPISSCGKKPFGDRRAAKTVSAAVPRKTRNTRTWWRRQKVERPVIAAQHASKPRSSTRAGAAASSRLRHRSRREHSIGVSVSDTNVRGQDRDRHHDGELVEDAADHAAHQKHRDEHGDQRDRDRDDGEADLARALERRLEGLTAILLHVADDVLQHDDGVVDDQADRQRQPHQRDVVDGEAEQVHHAERGDQRDRHGERRDDRCRHAAQEQEDHQDDQHDGQSQRELHVVTAARIEVERSLSSLLRRGGRQLASKDGSIALTGRRPRPCWRRAGAARPGDGARAVVPARRLVVLDGVDDARHVAQPHRMAVAGGDDEIGEGGGVVELRCRR